MEELQKTAEVQDEKAIQPPLVEVDGEKRVMSIHARIIENIEARTRLHEGRC